MNNVVRTVSHDGMLRGMTVDVSEAANKIATLHNQPVTLVGELVASGCMIQRLMSPDQRLQLSIQDESSRLLVDLFPEGHIRGMAFGDVRLGSGTILQVTRVLENGELHTGSVRTSEEGLVRSVGSYMAHSEQIPTLVDIHVNGDQSRAWMIQALPGAGPDTIQGILDHQTTLPDRDDLFGAPLPDLATMVMGIPHTIHDEPEATFGCSCSKERIARALRTLGNDEIRSMAEEQKPTPIVCDYCLTEYVLEPWDFEALLEAE